VARPRNYVPLFVTLAGFVAVGSGWFLFAKTEAGRYDAARRVAASYSDIRLGLAIAHDSGPILRETYRMEDRNGVSTSEYRVAGRNGLTVDVKSAPRETYDVSFFFEKAVSDGIWELRNRPPRGSAGIHYSIDVYQMVAGQHGSHAFTFTDPHYWATTGGHQFTIHLDRNKPVPDLLRMSSTTVVEPRYGLLLDDFTAFGSPAFRSDVAAAKLRVTAGQARK
jgi:hypothetical protein